MLIAVPNTAWPLRRESQYAFGTSTISPKSRALGNASISPTTMPIMAMNKASETAATIASG